MIASDILCTFTICVKIYLVVSLYSSGPPHGYPEFGLQTSAVIICSTYTTSSLAKLFLCALYFNLTKRWVISAILLFGIVVQLALGYASAVLILATGSPFGWAMLTGSSLNILESGLFHVRPWTSPPAADCSVFFLSGVIVASTTLLWTILLLNGKSAYQLFFYSQGRVYALTILGNFAVGVPGQHTPTTTPKLNTITGAVFPVKHTSVDDQAVITCDRARQSTLLRPCKC
ncbi:hypothetical protein C8R44DRAFT_746697 [Mycena epipterygia]|nr:hypothetical protein C8R44DRAFT_746697 [Mycena epipterygia]